MSIEAGFKPLGSNVLVGIYASPTETESGIVLPENAEGDGPLEGVVVATGPEANDVEEGDDIVFGKYSGNVVKIGKQSFLLVSQDDIFGISKSKSEKDQEAEEKKVDPRELRSVM